MIEKKPGYLTKFDLIKQTGVIHTIDGHRYEIAATDMVGKFENLQERPGVLFDEVDGQAVNVTYDPDATKLQGQGGGVFMGGPACADCNWQLPRKYKKTHQEIMDGDVFECPQCGVGLKLKSALLGKQKYVAPAVILSILMIWLLYGRFAPVFNYSNNDGNIYFNVNFLTAFIYCLPLLVLQLIYRDERLILAPKE